MVPFRAVDKNIIKKAEIRPLDLCRKPLQPWRPGDLPFSLVRDKARIMLGEREVQFAALEDLGIGEKLEERAPLDDLTALDKVQPQDPGRRGNMFQRFPESGQILGFVRVPGDGRYQEESGCDR